MHVVCVFLYVQINVLKMFKSIHKYVKYFVKINQHKLIMKKKKMLAFVLNLKFIKKNYFNYHYFFFYKYLNKSEHVNIYAMHVIPQCTQFNVCIRGKVGTLSIGGKAVMFTIVWKERVVQCQQLSLGFTNTCLQRTIPL